MVTKKLIRLDIGCGIRKLEGFHGVDAEPFKGVDTVADLRKKWKWTTNSVDEINCSHFLEHLTSSERCHVLNEMWRVLKIGAKAKIVSPHWSSSRAYGDPTHRWPPMSDWFFSYLNKEWRDREAPHTSKLYKCNFDIGLGYNLHPNVGLRNTEFQQFAVLFYKEATPDIVATLTKVK
jgi:hypothetical protein